MIIHALLKDQFIAKIVIEPSYTHYHQHAMRMWGDSYIHRISDFNHIAKILYDNVSRTPQP